jgi:hypothetical protein
MSESTFEWITKKWVRSSAGFEVKSLGQYEMQYIEGDLSLRIKRDVGFTSNLEPCVLLDKSAFDNAGNRKEDIIKNFREAMDFQGLKVLFE